MAQNDIIKYAEDLIKQVTIDFLTEEKKIGFTELKQISNNYIKEINKEISNLQNRKSLADRVHAIGALMHGDLFAVQRILILSHAFENSLNNFLGRQIPITWVSQAGDVYISDEKTTLSLYGTSTFDINTKSKNSNGTVYRGYINNVDENTFKNRILNPQLKQLQEQINKAAENKRNVFIQAKRRYDDSPQMAYAKNPKTKKDVKSIYWRVAIKNGQRLRHSKAIPNRGFIGQGYVAMVLHSENSNSMITYPDPNNTPPYDLINEDYLRILAEYAQQGDNRPGILIGDVQNDQSGNIQLAVKQGPGFHAAGISINIAIAYAIVYGIQPQLMNSENLKKQLENIKTTKWDLVFKELTGIAIKDINKNNLKLLLDIN